jgi:hypothetical protein
MPVAICICGHAQLDHLWSLENKGNCPCSKCVCKDFTDRLSSKAQAANKPKPARKPAAPKPTLRDEFAMAAVSGMLAARTLGITPHSCDYLSIDAYSIADAMLIERAKAGKA